MKSIGSYNRRGWVDFLIIKYANEEMDRMSVLLKWGICPH